MFTFEEIYNAYLRCRKGKFDTHNALEFKLNLIDIKNFFYSIEKNILFQMTNRTIVQNYTKVKDTSITLNEMLWIVHKIIFHDVTIDAKLKGDAKSFELIPPHKTLFKVVKNKGLPIGNLTSQFFANAYMNDFDNYCKRVLKCKKYIRYVDDFVIFENTKEKLLEIQRDIERYLYDNLRLHLRENIFLKPVNAGLDFLGYIMYL